MATVLEPAPPAPAPVGPEQLETTAFLRRPRSTEGFWGWVFDGRPQAARDPLRGHRLLLLPRRRRRGAAHPPAAGPAERHSPVGQPVQPGLHHARHDDDLPGDHAVVGRRSGQLHGPAPDRRPGRGVPAAERLQLLDVPLRRHLPVLELLLRRRARTAAGSATPPTPASPATRPGRGTDFWVFGPADPRHRLHGSAPSTSSSPSSTCALRA